MLNVNLKYSRFIIESRYFCYFLALITQNHLSFFIPISRQIFFQGIIEAANYMMFILNLISKKEVTFTQTIFSVLINIL